MMRSEEEVRREADRLEFESVQYLKRGRYETAADYSSDANMLRWVLGEGDHDAG